jgi:hypothetical protein
MATPTPVPATLKFSSGRLLGKTLRFPNEPFGSQGKASPPITVTVKNPGGPKGVEVQLEAIDPEPGANFAISNTDCPNPGPLAPGARCRIALTFTPTGFGATTGTLTLADNAHNSPQVLTLKGKGIHGVLKVAPASLAFGSVPSGTTSAARQVTLTNHSAVPFKIDVIDSSDAEFAPAGCANQTLGDGASCTVEVTFTPAGRGLKHATLLINDDAAASPQKVTMTGKGS